MKSIIVLALLLLGTTATMAKLSKTTITDSSFVQVPKAILNTSLSDAKLFLNATANSVFFSPGDTNETIYLWSIDWDSEEGTSKSIIRRAIDTSTLETKGDDTSFDIQIESRNGVMGIAAVGYAGFLSIRDEGEDTPDQIYFSILPANATSDTKPIEVKLTDNDDSDEAYSIVNAWFQDGYFYVLFLQYETERGFEEEIYLQAVKTDGSLRYKEPVEVASIHNPPGTTYPIAGPNNSTDASSIYVVYKEFKSRTSKQAIVTLSNGEVSEPTKLVADSRSVRYFPDGMIVSSSVFGVVLARLERKEGDMSESLKVYYNGAVSKPEALDIKAPEGYRQPTIQSFDHTGGFVLLAQYTGEDDVAFVMKIFNSDGSQQDAQKTLAHTQGSMMFFNDASGALWVGYSNFNLSSGKISASYLGKVME